jgi:hypothetical protein
MDTTVQEQQANTVAGPQVPPTDAAAGAVPDSPSPARSRTAHLKDKRTGRPKGSVSREPNEIAVDWVALHWHQDNAVPPNKRMRRLWEFARERPDLFMVMLERVRQLRGDLGPVKTGRAPRGATGLPTVRRVKRVLVSREIAEVTCQLPPEAYQQLPEEYKIVELFASKASSDYVLLIESDALSPVDAGGRIPEARLHVPQQKEAHRAATLSPVTIRNLGLKKLTLGWRELETLFKIFTNTNVRQKLPEDFRLVSVDRKKDGSLEFLFGSESFDRVCAGQEPPETGTVALYEQRQR